MAPAQRALEAEIVSALTRFLPFGAEGIADAQARSVIEIVSRRQAAARDRAAVSEPTRAGLRMLRDIALGHRFATVFSEDHRACTICRANPGSDDGAAWPCPVWVVATSLGVVSEDQEDFDVARDDIILSGDPLVVAAARTPAGDHETPGDHRDSPAHRTDDRRRSGLFRRGRHQG